MKIEYLRHKYAWSSGSITGTRAGWGIIGSSTPLDKERLLELEKLASHTTADPAERVPVESLVYSPECGYTKMVTFPSHDGEDGRKNKIVRIYQVMNLTDVSPEAYISPGDQWDDEQKGDYLEPLAEEPMEISVDDTLIEMQCYDRLPEFLRVVLEALFEETGSINIVANWKEEEFAENSRRLMYAIHMIIPEALRKKASYQSFSRTPVSSVTFYFSKGICSNQYVRLENLIKKKVRDENELEGFFYQNLAESYVKKDGTYPEFIDKMSAYYQLHGNSGNILTKLQWIFAALCIRQGADPFSEKYLIRNLPQLFYWCDEDGELLEAVKIILQYFHKKTLTDELDLLYQNALVTGYTKRSEALIAEELVWSMKHLFEMRPDLFKQQLDKIKQKNTNLFTYLMVADIQEEESFAAILLEDNSESFERLRNYLFSLNLDLVTDDFKDCCLRRGIALLNEDTFLMENYRRFDELIRRLGRQEQGIDILKDFVEQLEELRTKLDDYKLETGCFVESMLNNYAGEEKYNLLLNEKAARQVKPAPKLKVAEIAGMQPVTDKEITDEIFFDLEEVQAARKKEEEEARKKEEEAARKREEEARKKEEEEARLKRERQLGERRKEAEQKRAQEFKTAAPALRRRSKSRRAVHRDSFPVFFLTTFPLGFITGCALFMMRYSLKIGHGKIAFGMMGIWLIVLFNYLAYLQIKQKTIRTWQTIGMCLVEGIVIALLAGVFGTVRIHLLFFMVLGLLSMFLSVVNLWQERDKRIHKR